MLSVLVTDRSRISKNTYEVPQNITYSDLRVERIILANNWDNISDNSWMLSIDGVNKTINIPNGRYSELDYAEYLQQYLGANTDNVQWFVTYNKNTNKFNIRGNNTSSKSVTVKPNLVAQEATGFPAETTYSAGSHMGQDGSEKAEFAPSYVTIRSSTLDHNSYAYRTQTSDIICFFPLQTDQTNSVWQETTSFINDNSTLKNVTNQINLRFLLGDKTEIVDPVFSMEISFV